MTPPDKPPLLIRTHVLTQEDGLTLRRWGRAASDSLGRAVSGSAIVRALLRLVSQQGPAAVDALIRQVEQEFNDGKTWGRRKTE